MSGLRQHRRSVVQGIGCYAILGVAVAVGVWSGVALCDWLDPAPKGAAKLAVRPSLAGTACESSGVRSSPGAGVDAARRARRTRRPSQKGNWIADVWTGPRRTHAFEVTGVSADGRVETRCVDAHRARRGFGETIRRGALRKRGKPSLEERYARRADDPFDTPEGRRLPRGSGSDDANKGPAVYEGDVYISGIPMVDQGNRAYCAVASAARVLQGYGIEVTMDDLATLAHSSETGGTHPRLWEDAIRKVANEHGMELRVVSQLTESEQPLANLLYDYNLTARNMGREELYSWDYLHAFHSNYAAFDMDRSYEVQREALLSNTRKTDAFGKNVADRIDESDPIFWTVLLGDVPEQVSHGGDTALSDTRSAHMRLIIGYNVEREEILYSDSWGEGHELKRMNSADALSITTGMSYLTD